MSVTFRAGARNAPATVVVDLGRSANMKTTRYLVWLLFVACAVSFISGCAIVPVASDDIIAREIVGRWKKDETYDYGRFVGITTFRSDGTGQREFGVMRDWKNGDLRVTGLLIEDFHWAVKTGSVQFSQNRVQDIDPESPARFSIRLGRDEQEFVTKLTERELKTRDERRKIDSYVRLD